VITINQSFEKSGVILFSLTFTAGIVNYLFQVVMGRMLDVETFGVLNALLSLSTVVSVPVASISMITSKYVAECNAMGKSDKPVLKGLFLNIAAISLFVILLGVGLSGVISSFLYIESTALVAFMMLSAGVGFLVPVVSGGLQGQKRFLALGVFSLIVPLKRLLGSVFFVLIGMNVDGIILSLLLGYAIAIIVGLWLLKVGLFSRLVKTEKLIDKSVLRFAGKALSVNTGLIVLTNVDILLIKHLFSDAEAGVYSAASILGKTILFISGALTIVMFPMVTEAAAVKGDINRIFKKTLLYGGGLSVFCAIVFITFPEQIVTLLFGGRYSGAAVYMLPISIWIIAVSFLNTLANYLLAVDRAKLLAVSLPLGCVAGVVLSLLLSLVITEVVYLLAIASFVVLILASLSIVFKQKGMSIGKSIE